MSDPSNQWLQAAAGIAAPWRIVSFQFDPMAKMLHLWLTRHPPQEVKKGLFRRWSQNQTPVTPIDSVLGAQEMRWRHLNCMDYTCIIHTTDVLEARHHQLPWLGQPGQPFTNRMMKHIGHSINKGTDLSVVADLLGVDFSDVWKAKFFLERKGEDSSKAPLTAAAAVVPAAAASLPESTVVLPSTTLNAPPLASEEAGPSMGADVLTTISYAVWERLIKGEMNIQIKALGLQLLLTKLRSQVAEQPTPDVIELKVRELLRFMVRNSRSLDYELGQIRNYLMKDVAA